jgi:hypothetical protein
VNAWDAMTVSDLFDVVDRHKKALCEGGRADLARMAHITIDADGTVAFHYEPRLPLTMQPLAETLKALSLDPLVMCEPERTYA